MPSMKATVATAGNNASLGAQGLKNNPAQAKPKPEDKKGDK